MAERKQLLSNIRRSLNELNEGSSASGGSGLLNELGYRSERTFDLTPNTFEGFYISFGRDTDGFSLENAHAKDWRSADILFQLTDEDLSSAKSLFDAGALERDRYNSFLFMSIELCGLDYSRTQLARVTREINKCFLMPVIILFVYAGKLTVSVIQRRVHKREGDRDVLEKVTLIKDIDLESPHRAHLEILKDLSLDELGSKRQHRINSLETLFKAWQDVLDASAVNRRFYRELANWFYWADKHPNLKFPKDNPNNQVGLIRLITRLIFVWFLKEKGLVPNNLFDADKIKAILKTFNPQDSKDSTYYQAVLQNLFFATLNTPMRRDNPESRRFAKDQDDKTNVNEYMTDLYRYESSFATPHEVLELFDEVPFLNGGLFERLDRGVHNQQGTPEIRVDGFSRDPEKRAYIPNELFFSEEQNIALDYEGRTKRYKVGGLIELLHRYKFTVAENTPIEEEVALDPELLGQVFENLLAAYNPETGTTARKQTGSFYTPREIVDYMVDESLVAHLHTRLSNWQLQTSQDFSGLEARLKHLFSYTDESHQFADEEVAQLIAAIDETRIIDPACGSGAFPMGALQKLVYALNKLDPENKLWRDQQREREIGPEMARIKKDQQTARDISDEEAREQAERVLEKRLDEINDAFNARYADPDYARKLFLIENCIYGVDLQPIATQIAKLRFFISLIIEQKSDPQAKNLGIKSLPNLETKFVAADTLLPLAEKQPIKPPEVYKMEDKRKDIRHKHFLARTWGQKKELREQDKRLLKKIASSLRESGFGQDAAQTLSSWDPYDQNQAAGFFDPEWMFGIQDGFDIVIGNPPYVRHEAIKDLKPRFKNTYDCYTGTADLYVYFFERGIMMLRPGGVLAYICSNKYFRSGYGEKLRAYITEKTSVRLMIDFGDAPVFTAIAYPSILLTQRVKPSRNEMRVLSWKLGDPLEKFRTIFETESFTMPQVSLSKDGWRVESSKVLELLQKLRKGGTPLGEYVNGRFYYGIKTGLNEAFVVDRATRDHLIAEDPKSAEVLKPFLRGRDVKRWKLDNQSFWLLFIPWHFPLHDDPTIVGASQKAEIIFKKEYPAIYNHLLQYKEQLASRNRAETGIRYEWYALQRAAATYRHEFDGPKIIYPNICLRNEFAWDNDGYYTNQKTFIIAGTSKYLLAILNSQVVNWLFQRLLPRLQNGYFEPGAVYLKEFPIPKAETEESINVINKLVEYVLHLSSQTLSSSKDQLMIRFFEQLIDAVVYELYLPDALHKAERYPIQTLQDAKLPALTGKNDLDALRALFGRLFDTNHPVRKLVFFLDSLEEVRIIEGKEEKESARV